MVDSRTGEVVELLQALIRNRCVNDGEIDSGDESRNADALSSSLGSVGIDVDQVPSPCDTEPGVARGAHRRVRP